MNLKYFHVFFISLATILAFGLATMEYLSFRDGGVRAHLNWAMGWTAAGVLLVAYGIYFIRKARRILT